jgi:hypothetical protein
MADADLPAGSLLIAWVACAGIALVLAARRDTAWWLIIVGAILTTLAGLSSAAWDHGDDFDVDLGVTSIEVPHE